MPCYQKPWAATTSSECLSYLKGMPPQTDVASAMNVLRRMSQVDQTRFPEFGMFTLVLGKWSAIQMLRPDSLTTSLALHSCLFRIIQEEEKPNSSHVTDLFPQVVAPLREWRQCPTGDTVAVLADTVIDACGTPAMRQCNKYIASWKRVWDRAQGDRKSQPSEAYCSFIADPLPFWYLAKLYQVLYLLDDTLRGKVGFELPMQGSHSHDPWKTEVNDQIVAWLSDFRRRSPNIAQGQRSKRTIERHTSRRGSVITELMKPQAA